ncbi:hypothetical protein, partial [Streptomyces sp. Agncl-13]|uniref:hypothetical protein n=1 Tax=Streptomyces sp. Agncl-13 TaxID=3400628 RepID=UPI003A866AF5
MIDDDECPASLAAAPRPIAASAAALPPTTKRPRYAEPEHRSEFAEAVTVAVGMKARGGGMYRLVHFHLMWSVVPSIGSAISLLAVGAVRGFDEPFDNDTVFYLSCWAVGSALFAFWPGRMSSVRAEAKTARPLAPGTVLPAAGTSLAHGADWSFLTLPTVFSLLFGVFAGVWWTLWLACAMAPESLVTALYLIVRERRAGKVFWYDVTTTEEEPSAEKADEKSGQDSGDKSGRKYRPRTERHRSPVWSPRPTPRSRVVPPYAAYDAWLAESARSMRRDHRRSEAAARQRQPPPALHTSGVGQAAALGGASAAPAATRARV